MAVQSMVQDHVGAGLIFAPFGGLYSANDGMSRGLHNFEAFTVLCTPLMRSHLIPINFLHACVLVLFLVSEKESYAKFACLRDETSTC